MVVVLEFDGIYIVLLVVVRIYFSGVFTVGVGDPGGDGESNRNWLR